MQEMDIKEIESQDFDIIENALVGLREIWKKKVLVLLVTMAGFLFALIFVSILGNSVRYYSSATLFSAVYGSYSDSNEGVAVMNKYADMIGSSRVCNRAAQALAEYNITAAELQDMVSTGMIRVSGASTNSTAYGTKLQISVYADSSELVLPITNAMASAFADELNDLIGSSTIQVMDEASTYASFQTVNVKMYLLLITGAAFVVSCGIIFCMAFFSPWVKSVAQCEQNSELILGLLPYTKSGQK